MYCEQKKSFLKKIVLPMVLVVLCCMAVEATDVFATVYVKVDGSVPTSGDGLTWATAKKTIQAAMGGSYGDTDVEIWVKAGTYTKAAQYSVFDVRWLKIYGGFNGTEETPADRENRDWRANKTILDGSGAYYCANMNNVSGDVTIDGFTMTGASRKAVSVFCSTGEILISNCIFEDTDFTSYATGSVVGITVCQHRTSRIALYNCVFDNNKGTRASVVDIQHSYPSYCRLYIINSTLINNTAVGSKYGDGTIVPGSGATLYNQGGYGYGYTYIYNSILWNNSYITDDTVSDFYVYQKLNSFIEGIQGGSPGLADPENGDIHLVPGSPCIDTGTNDFALYVPGSIIARIGDKDFEGDDRFIGYGQDIGADEFTYDGDADFDGMPDDEENGPDGDNPDYDGNSDGIPDSSQDNVVSFHTNDGENYITLATPSDGSIIKNVQPADNPSPADTPVGIEFPFGFVNFTITGIASGGAASARLYLPADASPSTYWQYGPTPENNEPHWYEFLFDGTTGAEIYGNEIILHFVDGQRGDHDLVANGTIVDPGAPGFGTSGTVVQGDLDGDGDVDLDDRNILRASLRTCIGDPAYNSDADYDGDGCITFIDYREWLKYYSAYTTPIPG